MDLLSRRHWVFDLDGTLTAHVHDFAAIRRELGLEPGRPILEAIALLPDAERSAAHARVHAWEVAHLADARAEPDAVALLAALEARGARLGVLTRNTSAIAVQTLARVGLSRHFAPEHVLGRDSAAPKPSGDGVTRLLRAWGADPSDAVMVGDWRFDVEAGRAAGVATLLVDRLGDTGDFAHLADRVVTRLDALLG